MITSGSRLDVQLLRIESDAVRGFRNTNSIS